ncbi:hypothetical protein FOA52_007529 [Chlamydomonas sp. UWO 241]|nr:hypothetical protein FOA52_007529 [Chlamydomonas sp. UWO 241]
MQVNSLCVDLGEHGDAMCCAISPGAPLLATGLISGHLVLHTYAFGEPPAADSTKKGPKAKAGQPLSSVKKGGPVLSAELAHEVDAHPGEHSCRALTFVGSGDSIVTGSSDCSLALFDTATGALVRRVAAAHDAELSALFAAGAPYGHLLASGDEAGVVKLWDLRSKV